MSEDVIAQNMLELERADVLIQIRYWSRLYEQPQFEPEVPRIPILEFYDSVMPRFSLWVKKQLMHALVLLAVVALAGIGIKHGFDHIEYQDQIIAGELRAIELELSNAGLAKWLVEQMTLRFQVAGFDPDLNISICGSCQEYREGFTDSVYERLEKVAQAQAGKSRFYNSSLVQYPIAGIGIIFGYFLLRDLLKIRAVMSASRRLNDVLLENEPGFRQLG